MINRPSAPSSAAVSIDPNDPADTATASLALTTAAGAPVSDNFNTQTAGPRGPLLLQDVWLLEKLGSFHREVIPERRMHAKGAGAHGTFTVTGDVSHLTCASIFATVGKSTPMFARFSTVAGERGAADAERDIRGFALKFYTEQGNWDLVGNNTPVFFIRDPLQFPDLNHAIKRDPGTGLRSAQSNWDYWTLLPEALHQVTIVMSERGIPASYRHMHGFGSHTYSFINAANERTWVKFTMKTQQGIRNLTDAQAQQLVGEDRESHHRDLYESIDRGDFPRWTMYVQSMTEAQARQHPVNPFDLTKTWPHAQYPLTEVGVFELNRNPHNVFAEVEQAAFAPSNIVPGISFSPDRMLQARLFAYTNATHYRLGVNHHQIPVNAARCPVHSYHRDGAMRVDGNHGPTIAYAPNSRGEWAEQPAFRAPPQALEGAAGHWDHRVDEDHYAQPGALFRNMAPVQQLALFENTARALRGVTELVQQRHVGNCARADPAYGAGVADALHRARLQAASLSA
jgi:catalase